MFANGKRLAIASHTSHGERRQAGKAENYRGT
jgi:hypothetical protein